MKKIKGVSIFTTALLIAVLAGCSSGKLETVPNSNEESSGSQSVSDTENKPAALTFKSFEEYSTLIGMKKSLLPSFLKEEPTVVDEGGNEYKNNKIRVWFDYTGSEPTVSQVYMMDTEVEFNGLRIGDSIDQFKKVFETPLREDTASGYANFEYKELELNINYDTKTSKTISAYLVKKGVFENSNEENVSLMYQNTDYGFRFSLPDSWKGYTIVTDKWEGMATGNSQGNKVVETGPMISIRNPEWTQEKPRQDIPIMIFTLTQWDSMNQDEFHIGAAPIRPSELGRNSKYVFALPARYNFAFPAGYEEVETILDSHALQPTDIR